MRITLSTGIVALACPTSHSSGPDARDHCELGQKRAVKTMG
jgi:hypothetical protein